MESLWAEGQARAAREATLQSLHAKHHPEVWEIPATYSTGNKTRLLREIKHAHGFFSPSHIWHSQQLYFWMRLAKEERKEEKKDKRATLSIRMGWQYHSKPTESTSFLAGFRSLWLFQHQQVILMPAGSNVTVTSPS